MTKLLFFICIIMISKNLFSQRLDDLKIVTDDIYIFPYDMFNGNITYDLNRSNRLKLKLSDIKYILKGDYNGDGNEEAALIGYFNHSFF